MVLSDGEIWAALSDDSLIIDPVPDVASGLVQPSSVDFHLDSTLLIQRSERVPGIEIDPSEVVVMDHLRRYSEIHDLASAGPYTMGPGTFLIGKTKQRVRLSNQYAARVEGRSKLARLGLGVHITAPKIDPGFDGNLTLEMTNIGPFDLKLTDGMKICCLIIERLGMPAKQVYSGQFQTPNDPK